MRAVLERWLTSFWSTLTRSRSRSPTQPLSLGGLYAGMHERAPSSRPVFDRQGFESPPGHHVPRWVVGDPPTSGARLLLRVSGRRPGSDGDAFSAGARCEREPWTYDGISVGLGGAAARAPRGARPSLDTRRNNLTGRPGDKS